MTAGAVADKEKSQPGTATIEPLQLCVCASERLISFSDALTDAANWRHSSVGPREMEIKTVRNLLPSQRRDNNIRSDPRRLGLCVCVRADKGCAYARADETSVTLREHHSHLKSAQFVNNRF